MKHTINKELPRSEIENLIDEWIVGRYAMRDREIMRLRLIDGLTFEKIAESMGISTRGAVKIVYRCLDILSHHV